MEAQEQRPQTANWVGVRGAKIPRVQQQWGEREMKEKGEIDSVRSCRPQLLVCLAFQVQREAAGLLRWRSKGFYFLKNLYTVFYTGAPFCISANSAQKFQIPLCPHPHLPFVFLVIAREPLCELSKTVELTEAKSRMVFRASVVQND